MKPGIIIVKSRQKLAIAETNDNCEGEKMPSSWGKIRKTQPIKVIKANC